MAIEIVMPRLSDTMEEGRIIKWLKQVGESVKEGEPLLEVETDKADIEVEAFDSGTLLEIIVEEGETVRVGEKIGLIGAEAEEAEARGPAAPAPEEAVVEKEPEAPEPAVQVQEISPKEPKEEPEARPIEPREEALDPWEKPPERVMEDSKIMRERKSAAREPDVSIHMETREAVEKFVARRAPAGIEASPLARELAQKHGVDLSGIEGTGPGGEIVRRDVERAAAKGAPAREGVPKSPETGTPGTPPLAKKVETKATPLAVVLAEKEGIDLDEIHGTGIGGRIREIDVKAYAARRCSLRGEEYEELSLMRKTIARRMTESKQSIPHFYLTMAIRMDAAAALRARLNEGANDGEKISVNDIIIKAAALALERVPRVNATFADDKIRINERINIGSATTTPGGLIVPVIFDANKKTVADIAVDTRDKTERARMRKLRPDEYSNATFTVSNLGMFGIEQFAGIIDPGQSAILAVGAAVGEAVVEDGEIKVRTMMRATLSCDHRVIDGHTGTQYLLELKSILEAPQGEID